MFESDYDPKDLAGTGRHLTKEGLWAWTRFLDTFRLLEEVLSHDLVREHGMQHSDYEVLVRLDGVGGAARMSTLASQVVSSRQKLYSTVNRLESRGWIQREPAEDDGRGTVARLTDDGRASLAAASPGHAAIIKHFFLDALSEEEQGKLGDLMQLSATHLRTYRQGDSGCDGPGPL